MKLSILTLVVVTLLLNAAQTAQAAPPAFPGAEGYGAGAVGGRGGKVVFVDSLDDDHHNPKPGTLRYACQSVTGPRIVVFRTGGIIALKRTLLITEPFITIAGQTAPGDGICLKGAPLAIQTHDVIVRGLRIRPGSEKQGEKGKGRDSLQLHGDVRNVIVDHCSMSWSCDENISISKAGAAIPRDVTLQWCFITEALSHSGLRDKDVGKDKKSDASHSSAALFYGGTVSLLGNLWAHNFTRNPRVGVTADDGFTADFVNNVFYNWGDEAVILAIVEPCKAPSRVNFVGNTWIWGPDTFKNKPGKTEINVLPTQPFHAGQPEKSTRVYLSDNTVRRADGQDRACPAADLATCYGLEDKTVAARYLVAAPPVPLRVCPEAVASAAKGKEQVLAGAGAIAPRRDKTDERIVADVKAGTGRFIDGPQDVGGYPVYAAGEPSVDSDRDGMPDDWEKARHLDPAKPNANGRDLSAEYDNIEVYVNGLIAPAARDQLRAPSP